MKIAVLAVSFAIFAAVYAREKCNSNDDCEKNQCCIYKFFRSECYDRGDLGDRCTEVIPPLIGDKYLFFCPCSEGFKCEPERVTLNVKINERCVPDSGSTVPSTAPPETTTVQEEIMTTLTPEEE